MKSNITVHNNMLISAVIIGGFPGLKTRKTPFKLTRNFRRIGPVSMAKEN